MKIQNEADFQTVRARWGKRLLILGHYYVPDETIRLTDRQGDSLALSQIAAAEEECEAIIFCGVHFMAETADILANSPEKIARRGGVRIPVLLAAQGAGCPMADMAELEEVEKFWQRLESIMEADALVVPVTYVNSSAAIKAFCGRHDGFVCTSSNAREILRRAFSQREKVLFLPDQYLGRNTALQLGVPEGQLVSRSASDEEFQNARVILWDGYCPVHEKMLPNVVCEVQKEHPRAKLIVHPECRSEVVAMSAAAGSTTFLIQEIERALPGEAFLMGTEARLVERLRNERTDLNIYHLGEPHFCDDMGKNTRDSLFSTLEQLDSGDLRRRVCVSDEICAPATIALRNMLDAT